MASKVQICNLALSRLGAAIITSLTDGTTEANLCSTFFDDLAKRAMVQGSWTTTIRRVELAKTTNTPAYEFSSEFQLPVDPKCLRLLEINESLAGATPHAIEGDKLLTNGSTVKIKYIGELTDTEDYGPLLTEALEILLASYLAHPITGSASLARELKGEYFELVARNLAIDGQQGTKQKIEAEDLIVVR